MGNQSVACQLSSTLKALHLLATTLLISHLGAVAMDSKCGKWQCHLLMMTTILPVMLLSKKFWFNTRIGLTPDWCEQCFYLVASQAASAFNVSQLSQQIQLQPVSKIIFPALLKYDTAVHAFSRKLFLEKWVFAPNCHASVAIDKQERIVGYSVIRSTLREEDGWRIGPLFADDALIARSLYQDVCTKVAKKDPKAVIAVDVPYGDFFNPDTLKIVNELSGKPSFKCMRIYKKGVPSWMPLQKVFGITSIEIG